MKTLIVESIDLKKLGELVTVSKKFCDKPDIIALGVDELPGAYGKAYKTEETIGSNLVSAITQVVKDKQYEIVILSATTIGTSLAGPLAANLSAPVISEVTRITDDLVIERPLYGGKAVARFKAEGNPLILTIRRKYFEKDMLEGSTETVPLNEGLRVVNLIAETKDEAEGISLEDAEVIITGGRGIGGAGNFSLLNEMVGLFARGAVGASRGAVDEGWVPPSLQIGQTGKIVAPSVYFAIGVSGASQHLAGIANSKCVVAINKDEEANIFKRAQFGIVYDYKKVVPEIIHALREEV